MCDDEESMMDWQEILDVSLNSSFSKNSADEKTVYFVVDTNVLIQSLFLVKQLIALPDLRGFKILLIVPWQVLKELDKLKSNGKSVAFHARKAIRFLSDNRDNQNKVIFQRQYLHLEDSPHVLVEVPDDHIIKCCQLKKLNKNVLRNVRTNMCDDEESMMDWQEILDVSLNSSFSKNSADEKTVYFVVDTNVLIQSLFLVKQLIALPDLRGFKILLIVPWQVLKELDKLKSNGKSVAFHARKAIRFLSDNRDNQNKVIFQRQYLHLEDSPHVLVEVPDDHIIKCCCQLKKLNKNVILLSNDVNLCVKSGAIGDIPAVPDKWLSDIIGEDTSKKPLRHHCFEIEPIGKGSPSESNISWFMHTLTIHLSNFLSKVICDYYKRKYNDLWPLWVGKARKLPILLIFRKFDELNFSYISKSDLTDHIWSFFKKKTTYECLSAKDVEDFGRKCILFSQKISLWDCETSIQFDQNMGFLKTGNLYENTFGYTLASISITYDLFKKIEDKINIYLDYLGELIIKINQKNAIIPNTSAIINKIDKYLLVTNEATRVSLLLNENEDLPLSCTEIVTFHKALLDSLEIVQGNDRLPVFSPEDISNFVNQKRELNHAAMTWLSKARRSFTEYKVFLKRHC